jgi:hypothetical protein
MKAANLLKQLSGATTPPQNNLKSFEHDSETNPIKSGV